MTGNEIGHGGFGAHVAKLAGPVEEQVGDVADLEVCIEDEMKSVVKYGDSRLSDTCE
jgi:hypothetical protein